MAALERAEPKGQSFSTKSQILSPKGRGLRDQNLSIKDRGVGSSGSVHSQGFDVGLHALHEKAPPSGSNALPALSRRDGRRGFC
jgi:hypothetical protein